MQKVKLKQLENQLTEIRNMPKPRYKRGRNPGKRGNLGRKKVSKKDRKVVSDIGTKNEDIVTSSTDGYEMDSTKKVWTPPQ